MQNRFNLLDRSGVQVLADCEAQGILFVPCFPLAAGRLGDHQALAAPAERLGAAPAQIALAWLLHRSPVVIVIPGTSRPDHLRSNMEASGIADQLSDSEVAHLTGLVDASGAALAQFPPTAEPRSGLPRHADDPAWMSLRSDPYEPDPDPARRSRGGKPLFHAVRTVMTFAVDPEASARWWGELLGVPVEKDVGDTGAVYAWGVAGGVELGFHPVDDERNPRGGSPVVYWGVEELDQVRERLLAAGCAHHRGPLTIEPGRRIAQLSDPFGTVIGIEGP